MNAGNNYLNNMNYNLEFQKDQDFGYSPVENYEDMANQDNSDNLLEKMEVTLNTFLDNLKKDDIPSYPNFIHPKNKNSKNFNKIQNNYNIPQQNLNKNRTKNYYNPEPNLVDSYQNLLNNNINENMQNIDSENPYIRQNKYQQKNLNNYNNNYLSY